MCETPDQIEPETMPRPQPRRRRWLWRWPTRVAILLLLGAGAGIAVWQSGVWRVTMTLSDLLTENRDLKEALAHLTAEDQIGYAKVLRQETVDGHVQTTIRFVETARGDQRRQVLVRECTIPGDVVHFDALIVRFPRQMVMDGKGRALYLWRRIYGETIPPEQGFAIEPEEGEPARYADLLGKLPVEHRAMFWEAIWSLANNPERLVEHEIQAVYGNAVYTRMEPGLIYVFRIGATGDFYVESVPEL
jgi:hypothetical protein